MIHSRRRVVVTGMGLVSPAGTDLDTFWASLVAGRSAVGTIRRFDPAGYPCRIAAEVDGFAEAPGWQQRGRIARFAAAAARDALAASGLLQGEAVRERIGVALATGLGTYGHAELFGACGRAGTDGPGPIDEALLGAELRARIQPLAQERRSPGSVPARIADEHCLRGPVLSMMTACAGGTQALGDALRWIRQGRCDAVLAGGSDSELYPMGLASFCLLGALSRRNDAPGQASRPFDGRRDGFVLGEGAGLLVLEEREAALRRGARVWAEVAGFGSACDAWRVTDPHPDGTGAILAMRRALRDAGVAPEAVGYINAHGTSTPVGDRVECRAIAEVFGNRAGGIPVSSTKSMIGHLTVAAGAVEAIATILTLRHQVIHPTVNQEERDPECDLDTVPNVARATRVDVALSNSFAFGGQTATLVLARDMGA